MAICISRHASHGLFLPDLGSLEDRGGTLEAWGGADLQGLAEVPVKGAALEPEGQHAVLVVLAGPAAAEHHPQEVRLDPGHALQVEMLAALELLMLNCNAVLHVRGYIADATTSLRLTLQGFAGTKVETEVVSPQEHVPHARTGTHMQSAERS